MVTVRGLPSGRVTVTSTSAASSNWPGAVRRMLAKVGLPVQSLKRTRIGGLSVEGLGVGRYRPISKAEVASLKRIAIA